MALMVTDSYSARDQTVFRDGMRTVDERCRVVHGVDFMTATSQQRLALLQEIEWCSASESTRRRMVGGAVESSRPASAKPLEPGL